MNSNKEKILARTSNLSPAKRALLEKRLRGEVASDSRLNIISQRTSTDVVPLSFSQQRLWFLQQLEPDNPFYNECAALQLRGSLDAIALEHSLNEIVRRHEALRTTFEMVEGQPVQIIAPTLKVTLPVVNLCELPETEQKIEVQRLANEQNQRPFDLVQSPLLRLKLLQLGEQQYVLLFTIHHIVFDGWSIDVFVRELSALYTAFSTEQPSLHATLTLLPELAIQYADFAVWQRQELQGENLQSQLSYWKQQLDNAPFLLPLPTDRPRSPVQSYRGARQSFVLSKTLTAALKAIGSRVEATLFMTLLAAFNILLYCYTRQEDIIVGSPIANRNRAETEGLIGFFVNNLVVRTDLSGNPTFEELLGRVRQVMMAAYANQDLPFEKLVEELQPERNVNYNPLFQVSFGLQNTPRVKFELPGLTITPLEIERTRALLDLHLDITETDRGLECFWEYNTDLFDADSMMRMSEHFQTLIDAIALHPQQRVSQFPLLSVAQQHQLLVEWNQTQADHPQDVCIHQLFEAQVQKTPDAVAVVFEQQQLTYRELNRQANQLAHYLKKLGVKPEVLVGICVERSLEMIVGLLGILKAGGAYVPLDPTYPQERLAFMLQDAQVPVLLTQQPLLDRLPEHQSQVVCLDTDWTVIVRESQENPVNQTEAENLAYLIYTSGSTGTPKGVTISHRSLANYTAAVCLEYELEPSDSEALLRQRSEALGVSADRILQFASIGFDVAAEEIFPCLVQGATLVLRTDEMLSSVSAFLQQSQNLRLTVLNLPTAFWHQVTAELSTANLALPEALRLVIIGGEKALPDRLEAWQQQFGQRVRLVNCYGPTETTIGATMCDLSGGRAVDTTGCELPIGKAIRNVQTYVLDSYLKPVPIGVPGELYIGGVGVARGYLNRPELTAEKFIPNPFTRERGTGNGEQILLSPVPESRLYKTGDLVRYRPDGNIEYLGRIDSQVKIRGFRIELSEIEAVLTQHPSVREAVVLDREDEVSNRCLVAYLVLQSEQVSTITELRRFLKQKLPEYMVPSAFVILEALPLTPNGKIDKRSLPAPETLRPELEVAYVMPQTEVERTIASIWQQALNVENIGIHDNFFELGGHSLLMVKVNSQLREVIKTDNISILDMFRYPTISSLAEYLILATKQTLSLPKPNIQTDKIKLGKNQQKKRLEKIKHMENGKGV